MIAEKVCYAAIALIHLQPASLLLRPQALRALYQVDSKGAVLTLLHHRAALFVIVVIACLWAMVDPASRRLAVTVIATSMISFLAIYWRAGAPVELKRIALADAVGLPFLAAAAWLAFSRA